ncbi:MAG TPA: hypothetical protein VLD67_18035 [Vicinamibacterales bacterium]|nr:hypothetical protein [Vicinamibacterales bacterium]
MTHRRFTAALVAGLLLRVATLALPGHEDVTTWKIWSYAASRDVTAMYGVGGDPPTRGIVTWGEHRTTVDYPPLFLYEYALVGHLFGALFPDYPDGLALLIAVKLPVLLASAGLTWLLFWSVRRVSGKDNPARWAALAYWLNPATIFGGEMLGYVDPLFMLPAVAALVLAFLGRPAWAGVLAGVALATKPQGILVGPALAVALWQHGGLAPMARAGITCGSVLLLTTLPFYLRGALPNMWLAFGAFYGRRDTMSAYAVNIGWIVNWALRCQEAVPELGFPAACLQLVPRPMTISNVPALGYPNPRPIGTALVLIATAWAAWRVWGRRDLSLVAALGAFTVHAFFVLSTGVHESHQLFEVPLLVLAAALRPRLWPLCFVVSAIVALNINLLYGIGWGMGWAVPRMITGVDLSVLLSFVNVGTLVWFARVLGRAVRE